MSYIQRFLPVLFVLSIVAAPSFSQDETESADPVLIVQVAGPTLAGPTNVHLVVWDNGEVELAGRDAFHATGLACQEQVGPGAVQSLKQALVANAAGRLQNRIVPGTADLPSTTVVFFLAVEDTRQSLANTFTYNEAVGPYSRIQRRLVAFVRTAFPDCELTF